jgi:hypothetical protein
MSGARLGGSRRMPATGGAEAERGHGPPEAAGAGTTEMI